jgi:acetoin utilization protein AcuB
MSGSTAEGLGPVANWMSRSPFTVSPDCPIDQVIRLMRREGIRHVLVVDGGRLAGIVSNRDVRSLLLEGEPPLVPTSPVSRVMSESPVTTAPEATLAEAARAMLERKIGALPVVHGERLVGILTKSDALEALLAWADARPGEEGRGGAGGIRADRRGAP